MNFTTEQITKAKQAKSVEELLQIAKESGIELTEEQAKQYFAELHKTGELTDDELTTVTGGGKDAAYGVERYKYGDIVADDVGIKYEILNLDSYECTSGGILKYVWYQAIVIYVPESAKAYTSSEEGDMHYVHSAIVHKVS